MKKSSIRAPPAIGGGIQVTSFRLMPNDSLKESLCEHAKSILSTIPEDQSSSMFMITAVGSLSDVTLRLANASRKDISSTIETESSSDNDGGKLSNNTDCGENDIRRWCNQRFEIVSLVGTFCRDGSCHLHMSISDENGQTFGGHLMAGTVFTTVEVVMGTGIGINFSREYDDATGYKELAVRATTTQRFQCVRSHGSIVVAFIAGTAISSIIRYLRMSK